MKLDEKIITNVPFSSLPFNLEAEQSVIGAILIDSDCLDLVTQILPSEKYFHLSNHRSIYGSILEMYALGQSVDFVTVLEKLKSDDIFDEAEGKSYLLGLSNIVPAVSSVQAYAKIVKEKYDVRMLIEAAHSIISDATEGSIQANILLDVAEQRIFDIRKGQAVKGLQKISKVITEMLNHLDALTSKDRELYKPLSTGIADLDLAITGLNKSDLILLAARPGMGKTSFALNITRNVAIKLGKKIAFFSLEMTKEQLASRMLASEAQIRGDKLRIGKLNSKEWNSLIEAGDLLAKSQIYLDDSPGLTVPEIRSKLRRLRDIDLVVIDYLQLMSGVKRTDNRVQEISEITRNLKIMAKELDIPVLTLSQLSRASEQRSDRRPILSDLRDSGSIEQDADIVMFLYRQDYYKDNVQDEDYDKNSSECIVAKNRHGEARSVGLHWKGEFMTFTGVSGAVYE
ncbi:MAG: replicative DNA helicase [Oscillospiraceae bacterium]|jgi:replicative DNA helicase|nr:replicative DNA helicase [Oscillospiraceae bacterium]